MFHHSTLSTSCLPPVPGKAVPPGVVRDIIQWDVTSWSKALAYWDERIDWHHVHTCLELGAHKGGLTLWMALKGKRVVCSDCRDTRQGAELLHEKYDLSSWITYEDIDALSIPYENHFDIVAFKSIVGGIGRNNHMEAQKQVFTQIHKALRPGGKLLFAENLAASSLHQWVRKHFVSWGKSWRYITLDELSLFLQPFSRFEVKADGFLATFGRTEAQRCALSTMDRILLNKVMPGRWKYIAYGIAEK